MPVNGRTAELVPVGAVLLNVSPSTSVTGTAVLQEAGAPAVEDADTEPVELVELVEQTGLLPALVGRTLTGVVGDVTGVVHEAGAPVGEDGVPEPVEPVEQTGPVLAPVGRTLTGGVGEVVGDVVGEVVGEVVGDVVGEVVGDVVGDVVGVVGMSEHAWPPAF